MCWPSARKSTSWCSITRSSVCFLCVISIIHTHCLLFCFHLILIGLREHGRSEEQGHAQGGRRQIRAERQQAEQEGPGTHGHDLWRRLCGINRSRSEHAGEKKEKEKKQDEDELEDEHQGTRRTVLFLTLYASFLWFSFSCTLCVSFFCSVTLSASYSSSPGGRDLSWHVSHPRLRALSDARQRPFPHGRA